jgi:formiminotetrahydrofolate cyclodeaminase
MERDPHAGLPAYLDALASEEGTPGGGSASAVTGAIGVALGAMVCRITGRNSGIEIQERLVVHAEAADRLRETLQELASRDAAAFRTYLDAAALPRGTEDEKADRRAAIARALVGAAEVPMEVARSCVEALDLLTRIAPDGSKHTLSDVETASHLLEAAARGAIVNVRVNLTLLKDDAERTRLTDEADFLEDQIDAGVGVLLEAINDRRGA